MSGNSWISRNKLEPLLSDLFSWVARPSSVQLAAFLCPSYYNSPYYSIDTILFLETEGDYTEWYLNEEGFNRHIESKAEEFFEEGFLEEYISREENRYKELLEVCRKVGEIPEIIDDISDKEATQRVKKLYKYPQREDSYFYFSTSPWAFDKIVLPKYKEKLRKKFKDKAEDVFKVITKQTEITGEQNYRIKLSELSDSDPKNLEKELKKIQQEFSFLKIYNPEAKGLTYQEVREDFEEMDSEEKKNIKEKIKSNQREYQSLLDEIEDDDILKVIKQINYSVNFKTLRVDRITKAFSFLSPFYDFLMDELGLEREEVGNLTPSEVIDFFDKGKKPTPKEDFGGILHWQGNFYLLNKELQKTASSYFKKGGSKGEKIEGDVGNQGKAKGTVKIINKVSKLEEVSEDDVLVAQFTRPKYTPAIKRSVAIVTNDGGITSHAAIISRELDKPCVVGTQDATEVLSDGDLVEVDADKGIVKILD